MIHILAYMPFLYDNAPPCVCFLKPYLIVKIMNEAKHIIIMFVYTKPCCMPRATEWVTLKCSDCRMSDEMSQSYINVCMHVMVAMVYWDKFGILLNSLIQFILVVYIPAHQPQFH